MWRLILMMGLIACWPAFASSRVGAGEAVAETPATTDQQAEQRIDTLSAPLYSPFTERYLLDEVRNLRQTIADVRTELIEKTMEREMQVADRALLYATDTVTWFFYLIAGASTLLVLVGWNSMREIREKAGAYAQDEIGRITASYENRLQALEQELQNKSRHIAAAREEIVLTNEIHSLWLKASQEVSPQARISVYDQILALRPDDVEALTYKADAALVLGQPQWAISLANRALTAEPDNGHALYQRACAHAESGLQEEALRDLEQAFEQTGGLREQARTDLSFVLLREQPRFRELTGVVSESCA